MSNLSELLPTGGGQNAVDFVASGTLSSGQTVVLKADGTVEAVAETSISRSIGSSTAVDSVRSLYLSGVSIGDSKIVIQAKNLSSGGSIVVVGSISGTSISFGSQLVYRSDSSTNRISGLAYDSINNILTLAHPTGTNLIGYSFSISGTTLTSLGSASLRTGWSFQTDVVEGFFNPQTGSSYFLYSGSSGLYWSKATYSGGSTSWSSGTLNTTNPWKFSGGISYDPVVEQVLINCSLSSNDSGYALIGYFNSSGSLIYNSGYQYSSGGLNAGGTHETSACHIPNTNSHIFTWRGSASLSDYAYAQIIEWDGSTIDVSNTRYTLASSQITQSSISWNAAANKAYALVTYSSGSNHGIEMTVSGSAITVDANDTVNSATANQYGLFSVYDDTAKVNVVGYLANSSNIYRTANVIRLAYNETNNTDFIGITAEAISDTATGAVNVYGGINEAQTGLTIGSDYYVQDDGSLSTTASSVKVGQAISATTINMMDLT
ncbi:MAG: hypothetical protein CMA72_04825 [Euryarchaeota archaeon]|nr:hypothetical protein [Euryarchaeota archaeon]